MKLKKTELPEKTVSHTLQTGSSLSATISMSNQTKSVVQIISDSPPVPPLRERDISAQPGMDSDEADEPTLSPKERALIWLASSAATGYLVSFLFHSTLLTVMAIVIIGGIQGNDDFSTLASLDDKDSFALNGPLDTRIEEAAGGKTTEFNVLQPVKSMTGENESTLKEIEADVSAHLGKGEGEADGDGKGTGGGEFKFKPMGNAVTVGSFTAWTIPKDPDLNQDYLIIIQVKLPYNYKSSRYRATDLSGLVVGTDDHRQAIPWDRRWPNTTSTPTANGKQRLVTPKDYYLPVKNRISQLIVRVPGSKIPATRDTIKLESKILKEKQTLEIVF
ncbi:hypothetical protein [uncultured Gimesia sp.]|uniref:hypothetical protein n=1 Tax=uncultured Gimesia sp. TaxID=1678688 RepID=UPI0030DB28D8|tara:strand:- start:41464 stop:42462 length:999 start_codon:yes stop_codon:yes gene_type:complete